MDRPERPFGAEDRYLTSRDFARLCKDLRLDGSGGGEGFLEYLAEIGLVEPRWTIDLSDDVARHFAAVQNPERISERHSISSDMSLLEPTWELMKEIDRWHDSYWDDWPTAHPLDRGPTQRSPFVVAGYRPERQAVLGQAEGRDYVGSTTTHYYASWQIFLLAAISYGFIRVTFDPERRRKTGREDGPLDPLLGASPCVQYTSLGLRDFLQIKRREAWFDCVGAFQARSNRERRRWSMGQPGARVRDDEWHQSYIREIQISRQELQRHGLTPDGLIEFAKFMCELWDEHQRAGSIFMEGECRAFLGRCGQMWRLATGLSWDSFVAAVGRATGHFKPTIKVIFPDWQDDIAESINRSLKSTVQRLQAESDVVALIGNIAPNATDDMVKWLVNNGLTSIYWIHKGLTEARFDRRFDFDSGHRFNLQSFALFIEHFIRAATPAATTTNKLEALLDELWKGTPVLHGVQEKSALIQLKDYEVGLAAIDAAAAKYGYSSTTVRMLKCILTRHIAAHHGLPSLNAVLYFPLVQMLYDTLLLCWLQARARGWV